MAKKKSQPRFNLGDMVLHGMRWWEVIGISVNENGGFSYRLKAQDQTTNADESHIFETFEEVAKIMRERVGAAYDKAIKAIQEVENGTARLVEQINGTR